MQGYTRSMSTVAPPVRKEKPRTGRPGSGGDRPWLVIVLNDNHNTFDGVAFALARTIPGVTFDTGMAMAEPHPQRRQGGRLVGAKRAGRALPRAARRVRADDGPAQLAG